MTALPNEPTLTEISMQLGPVAIVGDAEHGNEASVPSWIVETVRSFPDTIWAGATEETQ